MKLSWIDATIVVIYLFSVVALGLWVSRRSSKDMKGYFLAGNSLPWYALGLSNASGMFDVAGTMWLVYVLFVYGMKSVYIPWLWPAFNQIFMMVFLAAWLRRSGCLTGAEWINFRFGSDRGARLGQIIVVIFALITVLGYMAFGFLGIGKLAAQFFPYRFAASDDLNDKIYALILVAMTTAYAVKGGIYSVVLTEVMQFFVMIIACIGVAWVAMTSVSAEQIAAAVPIGWESLAIPRNIGLDWSRIMPALNGKIAGEGYSLFQLFVGLALFKGIFQSLAGPAPNYDMQRILSARDPREASLMSGIVNVVLLAPRYLIVAGLAVLALVYYSATLRAAGPNADFEAVLPFTLANFVPTGLLGIILAGLLAAFMSSFAAALNAAPAYVVNDIYKTYIRPDAPTSEYMRLSYAVSILFVIIGTLIGLYLQSIDQAVFWITSGLYGGYTAANVVKWYWWRINGIGFFCGMTAGIGFALLLGLSAEGNLFLSFVNWVYGLLGIHLLNIDPLNAFPLFFLICLVVTIVASLVTKPSDMAVLKTFYTKTRPWGFWGPVHQALADDGAPVERNRDFTRDMVNVGIGIVWQTALVAAPILLVIRAWPACLVATAVAVACTIILKYSWYDRLASREAMLSLPHENAWDAGAQREREPA